MLSALCTIGSVPTASYTIQQPTLNNLSTSAKSSMKGAWALRRLLSSYTGPTINIRDGSSNNMSDFYANSSGNLGTALDGTGQSLSSWLGSNTGYVQIWYDQSGNGNHGTQYTTTAQPSWVKSNNSIRFLSSSYLNLPNSTLPPGDASYTISCHHNVLSLTSTDTTAYFITAGSGATSKFLSVFGVYSLNGYNNGWVGTALSISNVYIPNNVVLYTYSNTSCTISSYLNGTFQSSLITSTARSTDSSNNNIGQWKGNSNFYCNGELNYISSFSSNLSLSDIRITSQFL